MCGLEAFVVIRLDTSHADCCGKCASLDVRNLLLLAFAKFLGPGSGMRGLLALLVSSACAFRLPQLHTPHSVMLRCGAPVMAVSAGTALEEAIQKTIAADTVVIYSKSWCPYCAQCKALFDDMSLPYTVVELDQREDGEQLQATLLAMTQQRTVPSVFVSGKHIGGNDDTQQAARSGRLAELLGTTGATAGQLHAVETGKMITETEANVRKTVGVGVGLATAAIYATSGLPYATLSAGIFLSISTYRTGAEYQ